MMIKQAEFIKSITHLRDEPEGMPEFLLIGRSNVGKSSFINALTNRKNLARVSNSPGKTITLNFYLLENAFYLVDAPGYGYARRSKTLQSTFLKMIEHFIIHASSLRAVCLLIDFKVGPTADDIMTYEYLRSLGRDIIVIATKKDKVPSTHQFKQEAEIKKLLNPATFFAYSSVTKYNLDKIEAELRSKI
jgi:GTP-binding protein